MQLPRPMIDDPAREERIASTLPYVRYVARGVATELPAHVALDELVAAGREGLLTAADRYEPERGVGFVTYAHYRIRGAMLDHVRDTVRNDPVLRARVVARSAVDTLITTRLPPDAPPPDDPAESLAELLDGMATAFTLAEVVASTTALPSGTDPEEAALIAERQRFVASAIERMPEREREMLLRVYYEGQTVAEAGRALGLERSWASRLHAMALDQLRYKLVGIADAL